MPNGYYDYNDGDVYKLLNRDVKRKTVIYAGVSTKQKNDLNNQMEQLKQWCFINGYTINAIYSGISSGISFDKRKGFFEMLDEIINYRVEEVIITYRDRLSRVGSEEIFEDIISMLHCYSMNMYSKRKKGSMEIGYENDEN